MPRARCTVGSLRVPLGEDGRRLLAASQQQPLLLPPPGFRLVGRRHTRGGRAAPGFGSRSELACDGNDTGPFRGSCGSAPFGPLCARCLHSRPRRRHGIHLYDTAVEALPRVGRLPRPGPLRKSAGRYVQQGPALLLYNSVPTALVQAGRTLEPHLVACLRYLRSTVPASAPHQLKRSTFSVGVPVRNFSISAARLLLALRQFCHSFIDPRIRARRT